MSKEGRPESSVGYKGPLGWRGKGKVSTAKVREQGHEDRVKDATEGQDERDRMLPSPILSALGKEPG